MRSIIIILLIFLLWSCTSCNDSQNHDSDDLPDSYDSYNETDTASDPDKISDFDTAADKDEIPDNDSAVECLNLKYFANLEKTNFPLKDKDGKLTFCRPGCDEPTENDPQCVHNIWKWLNWGRYQEMQKGYEGLKECYPWPCVLPDVKSWTFANDPCSSSLSGKYYEASMGTLYDLFLENGKIGIQMVGGGPGNLSSSRIVLYNIEKDEFETIGSSGHGAGYRYGRFIFYTTLGDISDEKQDNRFIMSAKHLPDGNWKYEMIYTDDLHQARFQRPPFVGKKWILIQVEHMASGVRKVLYSKADKWEWHELDTPDNKIGEGNIVGDKLSLTTFGKKIYVCDLSKLPKSLSDCSRIDRSGEEAYHPRLDEENSNRLVYYALGRYEFILVDMSTTPFTYTVLPFEPSEEQCIGGYPDHFKGNIILYNDDFYDTSSDKLDYKGCFYRIDKKKGYCPKTSIHSDGRYDMGFNSFDGNYHLWKTPSGTIAAFRDLKCYCEKEGVCPFEE